jgi:chromosomal replication initiator protein
VRHLADCLAARPARTSANPLYLHGPSGSGKTHLVSALVEDVLRRNPQCVVSVLPARELTADEPDADCDLFICEDVQRLPVRAAGALVERMDHLLAHGRSLVFTALVGPRHLTHLPTRLTSRLASGLVVGLAALAAPSRLALLRDLAQRRQLAVGPDVLAWLAEHLTSGRQLHGALNRLQTLARQHGGTLDVQTVAEQFRDQAETARPTVERIAQRVGSYFQVEPRLLCSARRSWQVLWPRQVGMYLARQLTGLSLEQIGNYFGGRDHSTVLHACRKVERALAGNSVVAGTLQQLRADLV